MTTRTTYPSYRPSGIDWLGDIPSHWKTVRNQAFLRERNERSKEGNETLLSVSQYTGVSKRGANGDSNELGRASSLEGYKLVQAGDFVVNIMLAWNGSFGASSLDGVVSPAYCVYRVLDNADPRYVEYLLRTPDYLDAIRRESTGVVESRLRLYTDKLYRLESPLPPLDEQRAIADYLDRKDDEITRFIESRRRMIALLEEKKQAIINQAVTRGLDPTVPMKDSGVEWLGEIPAHWEVRRLKQMARIEYGMGQPPKYVEAGIPFLRATNVHRGDIDEDGLVFIDPDESEIKQAAWLREGDIIVVRSGAYTADSAIISKKYHGSVAGFDMVVRAQRVNPRFLAKSLLSSYVLFDQLYQMRMRAAQPHLNAEELGSVIVCCPPLTEQISIVDHIEQKNGLTMDTIARCEREIELMREYRTRLISDVVTGKVRVK